MDFFSLLSDLSGEFRGKLRALNIQKPIDFAHLCEEMDDAVSVAEEVLGHDESG